MFNKKSQTDIQSDQAATAAHLDGSLLPTYIELLGGGYSGPMDPCKYYFESIVKIKVK